jgi:hypothetical protein
MIQLRPVRDSDETNSGVPQVLAYADVSFTSDTAATDFVEDPSADGTSNGVCQVCHNDSDADDSPNHFSFNDSAEWSADIGHASAACTSCHQHNNADPDLAFTPTGGSGCSGCHDYDTGAGAWGNGYSNLDGLGEGKGAHKKHINNIKSALNISALSETDGFGGGTNAQVCGTCHSNDSGDHPMVNTTNGRNITLSGTNPFVPGSASYNGVPGTSSNTTPKTCSNVSCHFGESPIWSQP